MNEEKIELLKAFISGMRDSALPGSGIELTCSSILRKIEKLEEEE